MSMPNAGKRNRKTTPTAADIAAINGALDAMPDEIIEPSLQDLQEGLPLVASESLSSDELDSALNKIESGPQISLYEKLEANAAANAEQPDADKPAPLVEPEAVSVVTPKRSKKAKKGEPVKVAEITQPAPEPKKAPVYFHGNRKSTVLLDRINSDRSKLTLEEADLALPADELKAKQDDLLDQLDTKVAKKVAEKVIMLMRGSVPSQEIMRRTFTVLARDGYLQSGDNGNLIQDFLKKPFSIGTARSQANQMFAMLPLLKIAHSTAKGRFEPNPNSLLLKSVLAQLELTLKS